MFGGYGEGRDLFRRSSGIGGCLITVCISQVGIVTCHVRLYYTTVVGFHPCAGGNLTIWGFNYAGRNVICFT